jgi:hypothetical protein
MAITIAPMATATAERKRWLRNSSRCSMKDISALGPLFEFLLNNLMEDLEMPGKNIAKKKKTPHKRIARFAT